MSDSSVSGPQPSDSRLEQALRDAVKQIYEVDNLENLTVKRIRRVVEERLNLEDDYFKNNSDWKERSKTVIQSEVDAHADPASSPIASEKALDPIKRVKKRKAPLSKGTGESSEKAGGTKKRKSGDSDICQDVDGYERKKRKSPKVEDAKRMTLSAEPSNDPEVESDEAPSASNAKKSPNAARADDAESEMSEVLDDDPKPKARRKKSAPGQGVPKNKAKSSKPGKDTPSIDPDTEEMKRLQGWLIKCGIRKMWGNELKPYTMPKEKIRHLRGMLAEAGMTGRFSAEKAAQIKEQRELKADLEAVQAGNKAWGMEEPGEGGGGKPKRKLARGFKDLEFLDGDGEETD